jgi:hypothetical protein
MVRLLALVGAMAVAGGCRASAPVPPAPPPTASEAAPSEPAPETIPWSADRPLRWTDFRAQPAAGTDGAALTMTTLTVRFACSDELFGFEVTAVFFPNRSWVNRMLFVELGSEAWGLRHEQTHFDLTEVHARRARQFLSELARPCDRSAPQLSELGEGFINDAMDAQARYDRETIHGRDGRAQARWDSQVRQQLAALAAFERN